MIYSFENIELDTEEFVLRRDGQTQHVEPRVFDFIVFLLKNCQRVLTRDEIIEGVWGGRVISDTTVSSALKSARKALGDSGAQQKYIRTVRGRGFQFSAVLKAPAVFEDASSLEQEEEEPPVFQPSLKIMPFQVFGASQDISAIAGGLVENLTIVLTRVPLLSLVSPSASYSPSDPSVTVARNSQESGASYSLEGSVQKFDGDVRVNVQLIQNSSGIHLWGQQFDCPGSKNVIKELLHRILAAVEPQLLRAMSKDLDGGSEKPGSRQILLKAIAILSLKGWHKDSFLESASLLRSAIELEPDNALAHSYLALILALGQRVGLLEDRKAVVREAVLEAEIGLSLDGMDSNVLGLVGCALADVNERERAIPLLKRAIALNPNNGQALAALGSAELMAGHLDRAIEHLENGIHISPADGRIAIWATLLAMAHYFKNSFEMALAAAQNGVQHDGKNYLPKIALAASYLALEHKKESTAAMRECYRVKPDLSEREVSSVVGAEVAVLLLDLCR